MAGRSDIQATDWLGSNSASFEGNGDRPVRARWTLAGFGETTGNSDMAVRRNALAPLMAAVLSCSVPSLAHGETDYKCLNDCTGGGHQYNFCQQRCSYDPSNSSSQNPFVPHVFTLPTPANPIPQLHGTDSKCLNDCTRRGYQYNYCTQNCSY